jgi:hypothetical protein
MLSKALAGLLLFFTSAVPSWAQVVFSVDMDLLTAGIQNTRLASSGDTFTAGLYVTVDAAGVSSYSVSAQFDTATLSLNGSPAAAVPVLPGGLASLAPPVENNALGQVYSFNGATLGLGPVSTTFLVGTINYTVLASIPADGLADITLGFYNIGIDGFFDNSGNPVTPLFNSGYVMPVPEPGSATMLFGGIFALWLLRRRG